VEWEKVCLAKLYWLGVFIPVINSEINAKQMMEEELQLISGQILGGKN